MIKDFEERERSAKEQYNNLQTQLENAKIDLKNQIQQKKQA